MGDVPTPVSADWERWTANIEAISNFDASVSLFSDCPIGRQSCSIRLNRSRHDAWWDECPYFMGIKGDSDKACCGYLLNATPTPEKEQSE